MLDRNGWQLFVQTSNTNHSLNPIQRDCKTGHYDILYDNRLWMSANYARSYDLNSMEQRPSWELTATQLIKKFSAFHGSQRFSTMLTRAHQWTLYLKLVESSPRPHALFTLVNFIHLPSHMCYMSHPPYLPCFYYPNIWREV
jgi:hypothetical protein